MQTTPFNSEKLRQDFPILQQRIYGKPLIYLDSSASAQKPHAVITAMQHFYTEDYSNVHRAVHTLCERATEQFERCRKKVQHFINAQEASEIIFVRGTTEAINLVAQSYGRHYLQPGDEILISHMEHHSNIVPWQLICQQTGASLKVIPINDAGELSWEDYQRLLNARTKLLAITHLSNSIGTINPIKALIDLAHANGTRVLIDGAQAAAHLAIDVQALDCDFYAFSSHKMYGPTGIGVLYGKQQLLEQMPPYQGGGDMITRVSFTRTDYRTPPHKFEAGTPAIAEVIGLGAAIDYLNNVDRAMIRDHEDTLLRYATRRLSTEIPKLRLIGTAQDKTAVLAFVITDIHAHDIATILNNEGIAVRAGHHCTMPLMERFQVPATVRVSLALYNTQAELEALLVGLDKTRAIFN